MAEWRLERDAGMRFLQRRDKGRWVNVAGVGDNWRLIWWTGSSDNAPLMLVVAALRAEEEHG